MKLNEHFMLRAIIDAIKPYLIDVITESAERHAKEKAILGNKESLIRYIIEDIENM